MDVYFREDIAQRIVGSAMPALLAAVAHGAINVEYCRAILDNTRSFAAGFGIPYSTIQADLQAALAEQGASALLGTITAALPQ